MHLPFFAALAVVLGSSQASGGGELVSAGCSSIGCVSPSSGLEKLSKIAERRFSNARVAEQGKVRNVCGAGICGTEPVAAPLPQSCGRAGCATPEPKARPAAATASHSATI